MGASRRERRLPTGNVKGAADGRADAALKRITWQTDLSRAVAEANLVIESIPENLELKRDTYRKIGPLAPAKTIFATNTSTLLPSDLTESTGRPDRFLSLHFSNPIRIHNTAEVMGTRETDPDVYRTIVGFASDTVYNIHAAGDEAHQRLARFLKENYIDKGKLGADVGQGFYSYPSK